MNWHLPLNSSQRKDKKTVKQHHHTIPDSSKNWKFWGIVEQQQQKKKKKKTIPQIHEFLLQRTYLGYPTGVRPSVRPTVKNHRIKSASLSTVVSLLLERRRTRLG